MKSQKETIAYAKSLGINLKIDASLHKKYEGKGTTSQKLEKANKVVTNLKFAHR